MEYSIKDKKRNNPKSTRNIKEKYIVYVEIKMGIYFGVDIYGFKYHKKENAENNPDYEIKFVRSEPGNAVFIKNMVDDFDDENYLFFVYLEYSVSFEDIRSPSYMWVQVNKDYIMRL
jgi:hypothetical protein